MAMLQGAANGAGLAVGQLAPANLASTIGNEMGNALRTFIKYYGPFPYKQLAITSIPAGYGQGWPGLIYLSALTFMDPTQLNTFRIPPGDPRLTQFFRAHEASHQWWGHRVGWKSYHDQWLSEGFAQFSGNLYTQLRDNQKEYIDRLRQDKLDLLAKDDHNHVIDSVGPVWMGYRTTSSIGLRRGSSDTATIIYNKGGYALGMLRMMMADTRAADPDARFKAMMQDFCKTFDNKAASTEDFKAIAEKYMTQAMNLGGNHKLDWFFNQYVYGTGIPHYEFHYEVKDAGNGQWNVTGSIKRSGVPEPWMDAVPLFMERNGQMVRLGLVSAIKPDTPLQFTLPQNPGKLQINSNEELLAEIKQ
jgi:aminopeptidase N